MSLMPTTSTAKLRPRAYSLRPIAYSLAPQAFSTKTTKNANRPNTRPPQNLQRKKIPCVTLCHLANPSAQGLAAACLPAHGARRTARPRVPIRRPD